MANDNIQPPPCIIQYLSDMVNNTPSLHYMVMVDQSYDQRQSQTSTEWITQSTRYDRRHSLASTEWKTLYTIYGQRQSQPPLNELHNPPDMANDAHILQCMDSPKVFSIRYGQWETRPPQHRTHYLLDMVGGMPNLHYMEYTLGSYIS